MEIPKITIKTINARYIQCHCDFSQEIEMETPKSALRAIRAKCLWCSGDSRQEIKLCPIKDCPLYGYRFGKNPNKKGRVWTEEQKEALRQRLKEARERKKSSNEKKLDT